ncbi:unnamed protein product [Pseudo-nitzschia multistriata]|uniref:Methyltransferase type 11 domain-containing protein n=1 Tax=Pseudo-nitzschia multistriata TaxID=183589 RepID=A0A448YV71_9STRA|nr:unnamed protein product [Pseudo-nitzschia multistriata]
MLSLESATAFVAYTDAHRTGCFLVLSSSSSHSNEIEESEDPSSSLSNNRSKNRRHFFSDVFSQSASMAAMCSCCSSPLLLPQPAHGLAQITTPSREAIGAFDPPRNAFMDAAFAQGMAVGMVDYEREAYPKKKEIFKALFSSLPKNINSNEEPVIVEIGMGSFPNALYYKGMKGLDIIGIDPNDWMEGYAKDNANRAGLLNEDGDNLRIIHGVSEALPLLDASCDAVVCTLTLCSVLDPAKSVSEIKRVLKPGGKFLFWEHVLSQTDPDFARQQILNTPNQVKRADGCHLDRRTGETIREAGFSKLDLQYIELKRFGFLNPTVCGIATA